MCFAIFPLHLSKAQRLPRKNDARSYEMLHLSRKIISANLKIWCSKMQPVSGNQRPDLLTALMNMSLVLRLPQKIHLCRSSSNAPRLPTLLEMSQDPHVLLPFDKVHNPLRLPRFNVQKWREHVLGNVLRATTAYTFSTSQIPKVVRTHQFFYTLDLEMCFAPQRRALFWHRNFQKCSGTEVLCTFWLRNVLRATTACTFSTSQLLKVLRTWCAFGFFTCKCASRHNSVQLFISHLTTWLRTRRFSEPTFRPTGATNHWKKDSVSRLSYLFTHLDLLSSETFSFWSSFFFSSLLFSSLPFPSLLFSYSSHLCFSSVHIVGSLTSKLPSIIIRPITCISYEVIWNPHDICEHLWTLGSLSQTPWHEQSQMHASARGQGLATLRQTRQLGTHGPLQWRLR